MRKRRVDRLIVRAESAITEGHADEVADALDEVRRLAPGSEQIATLERALDHAASPIELGPVELGPVELGTYVPAGGPLTPERRTPLAVHGLKAVRVGAGVLVATAGLLLWSIYTSPEEQLRALFPSLDLRVAAPPPPGPFRSGANGSGRGLPPAHVSVETVQANPVGSLQPDQVGAAVVPTTTSPSPLDSAAVPAATSGLTATPGPASQPVAAEVPAATDRDRPTPAASVDPAASRPEPHPDAVPALAVPTPPKPERTASVAVAEDAAVRAVLNKYAAAYSHLDAAAAQAVWPAVNRPALSRAFEGLASQRVSLERCDIDVNAATARATCAGSATWSPRIGNGGPRKETRMWSFQLAKAGADWQIVTARVQNR